MVTEKEFPSEEVDFEERITATAFEDFTQDDCDFIVTLKYLGLSEQFEKKIHNCINYSLSNGEPPNILFIGCPHQHMLRIFKAIELRIYADHFYLKDGRDLSKKENICAFLTNLYHGDIVCLTHIESIVHESLRLFEQAVSTNAIDITIGKGAAARNIRVDLPKFGTFLAVETIDQVPKEIFDVFYEIIDFKNYDYELRLMTIFDFAEKFHLDFNQEVKERLAKQFTTEEQLKIQLIDIRNKAYEANVKEISESFLQNSSVALPEFDKIDSMDGREFELFTGRLLHDNGFENINVTQASYDFGVDVIAEKDEIKYAIQCKRYNGPIGVSAVQEVIASKSLHDCHVACVLTNSTYTPAAIELAKKNLVLLWDRTKLQKFIDKANDTIMK